MYEWFDLDEAAAILTDATGKPVVARDLLRMAFAGELRMSAAIPGWVAPGVGDLVFYAAPPNSDSSDAKARASSRMSSITDGFFRHLGMHDFQTLRNHGRLPLAGKVVRLPDPDGNEMDWVIGPEAPTITLGDLRVSANELRRIQGVQANVAPTKAPEAPEASQSAPAPLGRQRFQEAEILRVLRELGYDPMQLPRREAGKPGPKKDARAMLPKLTLKVFDKAWNRLRESGEIAGGN